MQHALVTTGRVDRPNRIILDEPLPQEISLIKIIIEPLTRPRQPRKAGALKGMIELLPGFDEPLDDFQEYMA